MAHSNCRVWAVLAPCASRRGASPRPRTDGGPRASCERGLGRRRPVPCTGGVRPVVSLGRSASQEVHASNWVAGRPSSLVSGVPFPGESKGLPSTFSGARPLCPEARVWAKRGGRSWAVGRNHASAGSVPFVLPRGEEDGARPDVAQARLIIFIGPCGHWVRNLWCWKHFIHICRPRAHWNAPRGQCPWL